MLTNTRNSIIAILSAILLGSLLGTKAPQFAAATSSYVDPLILTLVFLLFFELRFSPILRATRHLRFLSIAWVANFILIPTIGWGIAALFLSGQPLFYTGLLIYFMAPCTDWFLGFTRLAGGNTALGSVLLPINLISQLLLFPVYLALFAGAQANLDLSSTAESLWQWFILPFAAALASHQILVRILPKVAFDRLLSTVGFLIPCALAALITCIFATNVTTILEHVSTFAPGLGVHGTRLGAGCA
jgi:arsenite transporter